MLSSRSNFRDGHNDWRRMFPLKRRPQVCDQIPVLSLYISMLCGILALVWSGLTTPSQEAHSASVLSDNNCDATMSTLAQTRLTVEWYRQMCFELNQRVARG